MDGQTGRHAGGQRRRQIDRQIQAQRECNDESINLWDSLLWYSKKHHYSYRCYRFSVTGLEHKHRAHVKLMLKGGGGDNDY